MYCYQCQEAAKNTGCTVKGVCGKPEETAGLQDLLIHVLKGMAVYQEKLAELGAPDRSNGDFINQGLFATITNGNFDDARFAGLVSDGLSRRAALQSAFLAAYKSKHGAEFAGELPAAATWTADPADYLTEAKSVGVLATENEDVRSLRELLVIGIKGVAAYADHAAVLGYRKPEIDDFIAEALASTTRDLSVDEMVALVLKAGEISVATMALLDEANTTAYGHPEITEVNLGVRGNPAILISGHDLKDMEELLAQTDGTGVDVYTHGEMLPANYYPAFKKYDHFVGNYGGSWWHQTKEFETFNGPILMTTNCIVPLKKDNTYLRAALHHRRGGLPGREAHRRARERRRQGLLGAHRAGQELRAADRARDRHAGRRLRPQPGAGPGRQGRRRGQVRRDQALRGHGRLRRAAEEPRLLHRGGRGSCPTTRSSSPPAAPSTATTSWTWATSAASRACSTPASATTPTRWPSSP